MTAEWSRSAGADTTASWPAVPGSTDVAVEALRHYEVSPQQVTLAAESFNSVFRVTVASAVYALRVGAALQIHPEGTGAVEAAWHRRLRQHGVFAPDVLANTDGEFATLVGDSRARHGRRVCLLFEWVDGDSLRTCLTQRRAAGLGRLSARLQQDAVEWPPSAARDVLRADRVLYWQLPDRLAAAGARFGFGTLFTDAAARADGHRLALAPPAAAFRAGYSESRPWPDISPALFDSLVAARGLHQLNLTLHSTDMARLDSYVASHAERARAWMRRPTGL
jgi:hypothetical protein